MDELTIESISTQISNQKSYLSVLRHPYFNYINQIFTYTRSYDYAIDFLIKLLNDLEEHKNEYSEKDYRNYASLIYINELLYLYKLDRWDDFIANWNEIFAKANYGNHYSKRVRSNPKILPYIIGETDEYLIVHFLWRIHSKKEMVYRKINKRVRGYSTGNLLHAKQSDLSYAEIKERFDWMVNYRLTGQYNFDPPASKQKKNKEI